MEASSELAATKVADGVRFAWDFEVVDIEQVARTIPEMVEMKIKRSTVLEFFKEVEAQGHDVIVNAKNIGIRAFKKPVVSSR